MTVNKSWGYKKNYVKKITGKKILVQQKMGLNHTPDRGFKTVAVFVAVAVAVQFSSRKVELSRF